jgi:WS/DGAT/MGAT family acyltransferase
MRPLTPVDASFLTAETREMPMHVGSLQLFRPPPGAGKDFMEELYREWVGVPEVRTLYGKKLVRPASRLGFPQWDKDTSLDIEYHIRHSALPSPGRYRELFVLVSRLHGTLLDRSRPLWEMHLIEGLESGQFAVYGKMHHSMLDGVAGMRLLMSGLSETPEERKPLFWSMEAEKKRLPRVMPDAADAKRVADAVQSQLGPIPGVAKAMVRALASLRRPPEERMGFPFEAPRSPLNTFITGARRFVAQSYSLERVDRVRRAYGATVNDIILAMCASAMRQYLEEFAGGAPARPLNAMTPVSVRTKEGDEFGNAMTAVLVNLGTNLADPVKRLEAIRASMADGKSLLGDMSSREVALFTALTFAPVLIPTMLGITGALPPTNIIISNVPGPQKTLYWNGALLEGMYPASIVAHGLAVNITVTSYAGSLDFGIVACRKSMPRVQRLIDFLEIGFAELEQAAAI